MTPGSDDRERLEGWFRSFEELPASDAFERKHELVRGIVAALTRHAVGARPGEHAEIDAALARLQLVSAEAPGHDDAVLELIDQAREHLADGHDHGAAVEPPQAPPPAPLAYGPEDDAVDEASAGSFPASDPPSYASEAGERDQP